jgi:hypothetical protein
MPSTFKQQYLANKAIIAARAEARANLKCGDVVTIDVVDGEWRLTNEVDPANNGKFWARKVGASTCKIFDRARCTPVTAPALPA